MNDAEVLAILERMKRATHRMYVSWKNNQSLPIVDLSMLETDIIKINKALTEKR